VKLRWPVAAFLFALGAVASLVGDHSHVVTGTTEYLSDAVPFVWSSPIWFPILVALAAVSIAELRLHLPDLRTSVSVRQGIAGVAAVIGIYVTTAPRTPTRCSALRRGCPRCTSRSGSSSRYWPRSVCGRDP
jgi:hypothetical protein